MGDIMSELEARLRTAKSAVAFLKFAMKALGLAFVGILVLAILAFTRYGSIGAAMAVARGDGILVDAHEKSFGTITPGQTAHVSFTLTNLTDSPICVVGSGSNCTCAISNFTPPYTLAPRERWTILLSVTPPASEPRFRVGFRIYTDQPTQSEVVLSINGQLRGNQES